MVRAGLALNDEGNPNDGRAECWDGRGEANRSG